MLSPSAGRESVKLLHLVVAKQPIDEMILFLSRYIIAFYIKYGPLYNKPPNNNPATRGRFALSLPILSSASLLAYQG